ncbi:MAG TPA: dethiobiotin synthase, partial [Candidatus Limnocylindria bacterium]|nr:dethiobiotin synthase [Candidatus Limnocylindria bacterium]
IQVRTVKPFCSGGREDAEALYAAQQGRVPLDEINPWHFRAPLAPLIAARRERREVPLAAVAEFLRVSARQCEVLLVEGAGGVLSPLGEGYSARDLITLARARPLLVCTDRLGTINQGLMALAALPPRIASLARLVLSQGSPPDGSQATNARMLGELVGPRRVHRLPLISSRMLNRSESGPRLPASLRRRLAAIVAA